MKTDPFFNCMPADVFFPAAFKISCYFPTTLYPDFFQASTPPPRALTLAYPIPRYFSA
jgi:hypothetical protein